MLVGKTWRQMTRNRETVGYGGSWQDIGKQLAGYGGSWHDMGRQAARSRREGAGAQNDRHADMQVEREGEAERETWISLRRCCTRTCSGFRCITSFPPPAGTPGAAVGGCGLSVRCWFLGGRRGEGGEFPARI